MPTYEYQCQGCQKQFTVVQSMAEHGRGQVRCPDCGGDQVTQVFTPFFAKTSRKS